MNEIAIYDALSQHLVDMGAPEARVWPNDSVTTVLPRYEVYRGPSDVQQSDLDGSAEVGLLWQISVVTAEEQLTAEADQMIAAVMAHFTAGTRLAGATIRERPSLAAPIEEGSEFVTPITISLTANL